jgi:hypothetical protein
MTWDELVQILMGALLTLAGAIVIEIFAWRREASSRTHASQGALDERLRAATLRDLGETRKGLVSALDDLQQLVVLRQVPEDNVVVDMTRLNLELIGDASLIKAYGDLLAELMAELPLTSRKLLGYLVPLRFPRFDSPLIPRILAMRTDLLRALDEQEARAMRGLPLRKLTPEEREDIWTPTAMVAELRRRYGKGPRAQRSRLAVDDEGA